MSRILFLSQWLPFPADNGSKVRIYNLLRALSQQHGVTLFSFADHPCPRNPELESICEKVEIVPWQPFDRQRSMARGGFFSTTPRSFLATFSPEMAKLVSNAVASQKYDLVIASQTMMAGYIPETTPTPCLFEEAELGVYYDELVRPSSPMRRLRYMPTWFKHRRYVGQLLQRFRACTVVSEHEHVLMKRYIKTDCPVEVIPNFVPLNEYQAPRQFVQPHTLIFTGSFRYFANHDAMVWFLGEVYSRIRSHVPDVQLMITGDHANLPLPDSEGVVLAGVVPDIRSAISSAAISVVPIRVGGGTRMKILEAMALRTPIVSTRKGAEGLDIQDGEHLLLADTSQEFAAQVVRLLQDSALRERLTENAFQFVRSTYDSTVVLPRFMNLVGKVARH